MAVMMGSLYTALREAHVDEANARAAAEEVANFQTQIGEIKGELGLLRGMVGTVVALQVMTLGGLIGLLWKVFPAGGIS